ncbi:MAG: hypothetical protein IPH52_17920 [Leptospiraceae bacterium]|nr:hypothetical protein [Leptospiraceae bacterium]
MAKIISLAKTTNTPIVIVKPFYLFKYEKFTNKFWNEFVKFKIDYSELPRIREQLSEVDMLYGKFANFAYILDPAEEILNHIRTNPDLSDAKKMMAGDYVHFSSFGNGIVGNYIGQSLINLGLVKPISTQSWKHPSEPIKDKNYEMDRRSQYLKYKNINLDFRNYNSYLFCLCLSLLFIIVFYLRAFFSLGVILTILGLFCLFSYGQYVENLQLPLRFLTVILLCIFSYRYFSSKFSIKRSFHFLAFLSFISILFFVNMNVFSVKLEKMNKFSDISSILRENIAWSEYIEFFARKLADHIFEMEDIKEDMYKFQIPMPYPLISNLRNNFFTSYFLHQLFQHSFLQSSNLIL